MTMNKLLNRILEIQSVSSNEQEMINFIKTNYPTTQQDKYGNLYITQGDADVYPCVVAHLDTVHSIISQSDYCVIERNNKAFAYDTGVMTETGIGGDDKVGIYIALAMLEMFDNIKLAFFIEEEIGTVGSTNADMRFFNDVGYVIQADRQGYKDTVVEILGSQICSDEFIETIADKMDYWGKELCTNGGLTDVYALKENDLDVSVINVSCGYYRPHTASEYLDLIDVENTKNFIADIIEKLGEEKYPHDFEKYVYPTYNYGYKKHSYKPSQEIIDKYDLSGDFNDYLNGQTAEELAGQHRCSHCGSYDTWVDYNEDALFCFTCNKYSKSKDVDVPF